MHLEAQVNQRLQSIANALLLNENFTDTLGLLNGKMGIAIFFYHCARYTDKEEYNDYAGKLIDEVIEHIDTITTTDFANGLTGIGWGIEYLIQNGFVEGNSDEILEEMDKILFQTREQQATLIENCNDLFGYGLYYLARLKGYDHDSSPKTLIKKQMLLFLINECENMLVHKRFLEYRIPVFTVSTLNSISFFLLKMYKLELERDKIDKLFRYLHFYYEFSIKYLNDTSEPQLSMLLLKHIEPLTKDKDIREKYITLVHSLSKTEVENSKEQLINNCSSIGWNGLVYYNMATNMDGFPLQQNILTTLDRSAVWLENSYALNQQNYGLTGIAGVGLYLIKRVKHLKSTFNTEKVNE